jgi:NAD(P)-dependent dehydrogenase (short-subunit alcohol dehydrogenase family)
MAQQNKTALVTGSSRGIGRAAALALAETSAHVLGSLRPPRPGSPATIALLSVSGRQIIYSTAHTSSQAVKVWIGFLWTRLGASASRSGDQKLGNQGKEIL